MTTEMLIDAAVLVETGRASPVGADRRRILAYLGVLYVLVGFGWPQGGLIGLPVSFFLKNKLHLTAHQVAVFGLISNIPLYLAFAFGFARDLFNPLGMRDRGFLVVFGIVGAAICLYAATTPPSYGALLIAVLLLTTTWLFLESALRGLTCTIGQQQTMSGQVTAAWQTITALPALAAFLAGGVLSQLMEGDQAAQGARTLFLVGAGLMALTALYGLVKPASVFAHLHAERLNGERPLADLARLARHWPVYPALLIWLLWNFVPGLATALQYFMQNTLHGDDAQSGLWRALYSGGFIPTYLLFGWLCRRFPLKSLLLWGTLVALPMMFPLLIIHDMNSALLVAAPMGLVGGVATAAYLDLIIRSAPKGLQGTVMMAAAGMVAVDAQFGDLLGTSLYDHFHDFNVCVIAMTVTNLLIIPVLLFVPKRIVDYADGEAARSA